MIQDLHVGPIDSVIIVSAKARILLSQKFVRARESSIGILYTGISAQAVL